MSKKAWLALGLLAVGILFVDALFTGAIIASHTSTPGKYGWGGVLGLVNLLVFGLLIGALGDEADWW